MKSRIVYLTFLSAMLWLPTYIHIFKSFFPLILLIAVIFMIHFNGKVPCSILKVLLHNSLGVSSPFIITQHTVSIKHFKMKEFHILALDGGGSKGLILKV